MGALYSTQSGLAARGLRCTLLGRRCQPKQDSPVRAELLVTDRSRNLITWELTMTMTKQESGAATELANRWSRIPRRKRAAEFHRLPRGAQDDFFLALDTHGRAELLRALPESERRVWMRLLAPQDAADVLQHVPRGEQSQLLELLDEPTRTEVNALLAFKEDEAGGLMSPRFARLRVDVPVEEALAYLKQQARYLKDIEEAFVLDQDQRLVGVVSLSELFLAENNKRVSEVMRTDVPTVDQHMDQEEVARALRRSHLHAIPVVDAQKHMVGVVTVDDIVGVIDEEASEDMQKVGGMEALDEPYLETSFFELIKKRAGWLAILFLGEMLTATALGYFEGELDKAVVLALFLPLIISSGGNSGAQATTLVIRAMALGEVALRDWFRVIRRELFAGVALGCILAVIGMTRILAWQGLFGSYGQHYIVLALTIAFSLVGVVMFGTIAGATLPFILRRVGLDPASASAPFVATLVDVTGLIIYFTVAKVVLTGTLL
jgi:magnesium transporter